LHIVKFCNDLVIKFEADGLNSHPEIVDLCDLLTLCILLNQADEERPCFLKGFFLLQWSKKNRINGVMVQVVVNVDILHLQFIVPLELLLHHYQL